MPRLDMVTGLYYLTTRTTVPGRVRPGGDSRRRCVQQHRPRPSCGDGPWCVSVRARDQVRLTQLRPPHESITELFGADGWRPVMPDRRDHAGRVLFNELLPLSYPFVNEQMHKKVQARIINDLAERFPMIVVAQTVDKLKDAGSTGPRGSGVTVSMADVLVPPEKQEILEALRGRGRRHREEVPARQPSNHQGTQRRPGEDLAEGHRRGRRGAAGALPGRTTRSRRSSSPGATGNFTQTRTLAGMKGLVTNPKGEFIPRPIKSSFREA